MVLGLQAWMLLAVLPLPPTDDGAACEAWAVQAALANPAFEAEELRFPPGGEKPTR